MAVALDSPSLEAPSEISWEQRGTIQQHLLLGEYAEIASMHPQTRPLSQKSDLERVYDPPACISNEPVVYRLPATNSDVYVVGDSQRRVVKIRDGQKVEERAYVEGFTLDGILLSPKEVRLAFSAIEAFHGEEVVGDAPSLKERMPWAREETLQNIMALPGPVVRCHLDATAANILVTPSCDLAMLIDDEYHAMAPAVFDYGIFVAKLKRKEGICLPAPLLPDMPGLKQAAELAHQLWLESR